MKPKKAKQPKIADVNAAYLKAVERLQMLRYLREDRDPDAKGTETYTIRAGIGLELVITLGKAGGKITGHWRAYMPVLDDDLSGGHIAHRYETIDAFNCTEHTARILKSAYPLPNPDPLGSFALGTAASNKGHCVSVRGARALLRWLTEERRDKIERDLHRLRLDYWERSERAFSGNDAQGWRDFVDYYGSRALGWGGDAAELLAEFAESEGKRYAKADKSVAGFTYVVRIIQKELRGVNVQDFSAVSAALFGAHFAPETVQDRAVRTFRRFLDWCVLQGRLMMNPFDDIAFKPYPVAHDPEMDTPVRVTGRLVPESLYSDFFEPLGGCLDAAKDASLIRLIVLCVLTVSPFLELTEARADWLRLSERDPRLLVPPQVRGKHSTMAARRVLLSAAAVKVVQKAAKAGGGLLFPNSRGHRYTAQMLSRRTAKALQGRCTLSGAAIGAFRRYAAGQGAADAVISIVCGNKVKTELRSELEPQARELLEEWGKAVTASVPDDWRSVCGF